MSATRWVPPLIVTLLILLSFGTAAQDGVLQAPTYRVGNRWEYLLEGRISALEGFANLTGLLEVSGLSTARVDSIDGENISISWSSDLTVGGSFSIPGEGGGVEASIEGSIEASRTEHMADLYFLPVRIEETTEFDLTLSVGFSVTYAASTQTVTTVTPDPTYPAYPLEEGEREFEVPVRFESNVTASFFGAEVVNESSEDVRARTRFNVSSAHETIVPAGSFQAVRTETETVAGVGLGPFAILFPGARQVAFHSEDVGNVVMLQFLSNETLLGNATLRSFSYAPSSSPLWQQPLFIAVMLAVPAAVLLYLYWRERRKGL